MSRRTHLGVLWVCLLAAPGFLVAQSNEDISSVLQFNFSNPGARSLGMAGAFTARSDDATAVYSNPAGLVQLSRPEISIEGRYWSLANRFLASGAQLDPSSLAGLTYDDSQTRTRGLSFLSGFYPSRSGRWVVGLFKHQTVNFETELHTDNATVFTNFGTGFARPRDGFLDLDLDTVGASFAVRVLDSMSLGATVTTWDFELDSRLELYDAPRDQEVGDEVFNPFSLDDPYPGLTEGDPEICCRFGNRGDIIRLRTQQGEDESLSFTVGVLWRSKRTRLGVPLFSAGAVYRRGPTFSFVGRSYIRSLTPSITLPTTRVYLPVFADGQGVFDVPDVIGAGFSARPSRRWVLSVDYSRVEYGDLMKEFLDLAGRDSAIPDGQTGTPADYRLEDGDEYRLGFEYAVNPESGRVPLFLRWGVWHDPNHEIEYVGPDSSQRPIFSPGDDELHYALGLGMKLRDFQLDAAVDLSDRIDSFSLSTVFYFGRD
jgi:long-subunit fatty acid transport protein